MPDFRQNFLTGDWVIVAEDRATRPGAFASPLEIDDTGECPFCEGNEHETPHETFAVRSDGSRADGPGWQVRMVPNRYPAISSYQETMCEDASDNEPANRFQSRIPATGVHDVVIESPRHVRSLAELTTSEAEIVVRAYRDRMRKLATREDIACLILFKNSGAGAGASLAHIHSQLIGLAHVPTNVASRVARCHAHYQEHGHLLLDDLLAEEIAAEKRVVTATDHFVVLCPWASKFPAETWILPRKAPARFELLDDAQVKNFAKLLHETLRLLERTTNGGPYNWFLNNPPTSEPANSPARWYLTILPRLANPGGFEWATGIHINPVSPERAAAHLRDGQSLVS
ncbi:MAG: DUF4921 family protein [Pirellulales bacterium]|nr:DUF4921 family protein [Pirellulales bacterium]